MIKKAKRYFNTSGPNHPGEHYTLRRQELVAAGIEFVEKSRYFTIWAPRQSGKSTYIQLLREALKSRGVKSTYVNVENFKDESLPVLMDYLTGRMNKEWGTTFEPGTFGMLYNDILQTGKKNKLLLIIDEIEGLNPELFNQFLHTIRNLYHFRGDHGLKSVVLVGVSNIVGVVQDNTSPFNIADNLETPYFSTQETFQLLGMHEEETGQLFSTRVKEKIAQITACQPGLVNGFAYQLVTRSPKAESIGYDDYLEVEDWYLTAAIDKNISNIINKAKKYRTFVETLLFTEKQAKFRINDEKIKFLHTHGLIRKDSGGYVDFWVPIYKKAVFDAFYPHSNGESDRFFRNVDLKTLFFENGRIDFHRLIDNYKDYVKRRSFKYFREKNKETGKFEGLKEAAVAYSFETFIQAFLQETGGTSYLEPHTGLGRSDLLINIAGREYVIEFKIYRSLTAFTKGKKQVAYYAQSMGINEGIYLVFVPNTITLPDIKESVETVDGIEIETHIVHYDETKDF